MFKGDYNFFDYKYNILGYHGQDFGGFPQYLYLIISFILMILLLFLFRKSNKKKVNTIIKYIGLFMIVFYIVKTTWETIYDIKIVGKFNTGLLPFDTCSIIMLATVISSFSHGKLKECADGWLATGSVVAGFSTMIILNAFKYYPFLSFGAFYSMIWHFLMVFVGLLIITTNYVKMDYITVIKGFIFHLIISLIVIPIDFIFDFDFMMYRNLSSIPLFEDIGSKLSSINLQFVNPIIMLALYFLAFHIPYLVKIIVNKIKNSKQIHLQ